MCCSEVFTGKGFEKVLSDSAAGQFLKKEKRKKKEREVESEGDKEKMRMSEWFSDWSVFWRFGTSKVVWDCHWCFAYSEYVNVLPLLMERTLTSILPLFSFSSFFLFYPFSFLSISSQSLLQLYAVMAGYASSIVDSNRTQSRLFSNYYRFTYLLILSLYFGVNSPLFFKIDGTLFVVSIYLESDSRREMERRTFIRKEGKFDCLISLAVWWNNSLMWNSLSLSLYLFVHSFVAPSLISLSFLEREASFSFQIRGMEMRENWMEARRIFNWFLFLHTLKMPNWRFLIFFFSFSIMI